MPSLITGNAEVAIHLYQALEGKAPSYALLNSYTSQMAATSQAAWASQFGASYTESTAAFVTRVMTNMSLTVANITQPGYDALYAGAVQYFDSVGVAGRGVAVAQLGEIISNLENATGDLAIYKTAAVAYNNQSLGNFNYASLTTSTNPAVVSPADSNVGQTYTLTTGADTFTGSTGNDTFNGGLIDSFSSFDALDGGEGTDTLTVLTTATAVGSGVSVKNIETATINTSGTGYTIDASGYTGLTKLTVNGASVTTGANMTVTAATTTVTNVSAAGYDGDFTVTGGKDVTVSGTLADDMLISGGVGVLTATGGAEAADKCNRA